MKVSIRFLFTLFFLPLTTGCFDVLQVIDARRDGTIRMSVRVSAAKSLQKEEEKNRRREPAAKDLIHDTERIYSKIVTRDLSDDVISRRQFDFTTSRSLLRRVHDDDRGMFLPYPDGGHQWVFLFPAVTPPPGMQIPASSSKETKQPDLASALLSSATYRIFFRGIGQPRRAAFTGLDGKRVYLRVTAFGDFAMIDVPILLLARGGVLTTGVYWQIDFNRTDRLVAFLKTQGAVPFEETGKEETGESDETPADKPASGDDVPPGSNEQPVIPAPKK